MQEPERDEDAADEANALAPQTEAAEPKAYAFDGWGMVPLELDAV